MGWQRIDAPTLNACARSRDANPEDGDRRRAGGGRVPGLGRRAGGTYYSFPLLSWRATLDYQLVVNPGYNADRGPVSVIATRLHTQF